MALTTAPAEVHQLVASFLDCCPSCGEYGGNYGDTLATADDLLDELDRLGYEVRKRETGRSPQAEDTTAPRQPAAQGGAAARP